MRKILFSAAMLMISIGSAKEWTLAECLRSAEEKSLSLQVAKLSENQADVAIKNAKIDRYPTVSANIQNTLYDSPFREGPQDHYRLSLGINGSMTLWDGGATSLSVETASLSKQEASMRTEMSLLSVRENVLNAFFGLLLSKEKIAVAKVALEVSEAEYENNMKLFEAGTLTRRDVVLSQSDLTQKKVSLLLAEQSFDNSKTRLRQLMELSAEEEFEIASSEFDSLLPDSLWKAEPFDKLLNSVQSNYPGLLADSLAALSAQKNVKLAGKGNSISVTLGAQASTGLQAWESSAYGSQIRDGYNHSITLGINIPIIDRGATSNKVLSAQIESARAQISKQETGKDLENNIEQLYLNAIASNGQWVASLLQVEAAEAAYRVAEDQKAVGAITYTDYLSIKNNLDSAKLSLSQAKYTFLLAQALLNLYAGKNFEK